MHSLDRLRTETMCHVDESMSLHRTIAKVDLESLRAIYSERLEAWPDIVGEIKGVALGGVCRSSRLGVESHTVVNRVPLFTKEGSVMKRLLSQ